MKHSYYISIIREEDDEDVKLEDNNNNEVVIEKSIRFSKQSQNSLITVSHSISVQVKSENFNSE
jgi:hypothetical protein